MSGVLDGCPFPVDLIVLLVSELATNAVLHARTDYVVRVGIDDDAERVRIEVEDANERPPSIVHTPPEATSGRGLQLIQTLAEAWGVEGRIAGKLVWFEMSSHDDGSRGWDREAAHRGVRPGSKTGAHHREQLVDEEALAS